MRRQGARLGDHLIERQDIDAGTLGRSLRRGLRFAEHHRHRDRNRLTLCRHLR
jgi:hypothetical protein